MNRTRVNRTFRAILVEGILVGIIAGWAIVGAAKITLEALGYDVVVRIYSHKNYYPSEPPDHRPKGHVPPKWHDYDPGFVEPDDSPFPGARDGEWGFVLPNDSPFPGAPPEGFVLPEGKRLFVAPDRIRPMGRIDKHDLKIRDRNHS